MASPSRSADLELQIRRELQPLIIDSATLTGKTIGSGSYGSVVEVAIPGALCAAKKIHDFLITADVTWLAKKTAETNIRKFVSECKMMNKLRHPNVVQFLGIFWEETSSLYLVMEKMLISLHDMLVPDHDSRIIGTQPSVPLGLKCSILQDIARGIAYLHKQKPPVIHRDLTAANVLLNSSMVAKIADMGMARILPEKVNTALTKIPGAMVYMPPEAMEDKSQYNTSIDMFSFGVVAIFLMVQEFPSNPKAPTYNDEKGVLVARTELERRENYTAIIYSKFPKTHPLIQLIESCLENKPQARPSIDQALQLLDWAMAGIQDSPNLQLNKLQLLQEMEQNTALLHELEMRSQLELESMWQKCDAWREEVEKLSPLRDEVTQLHQENARLQQELAQVSEDNTGLARQLQETNVMKMRSQSELESMRQKCDACREEVEKLSPLRVEVAHLHQENARLQQDVKEKDLLLMERESYMPDTISELTASVQSTSLNDKMPRSGIRDKQKSFKTRGSELDSYYDAIADSTDTSSLGPRLSGESKPHSRMETWFVEMDRDCAEELLKNRANGTFLCRPTSQRRELPQGLHTHTIDVMQDGVRHFKVMERNGQYSLSDSCTFSSIMELVLYFSEHPLVLQYPGVDSTVTTTLQIPALSVDKL